MKCKAITLKNERCKKNAIENNEYCAIHKKLADKAVPESSESKAKKETKPKAKKEVKPKAKKVAKVKPKAKKVAKPKAKKVTQPKAKKEAKPKAKKVAKDKPKKEAQPVMSSTQDVRNIKKNILPWMQDILNLKEVNGWVINPNKIYSTADFTLVVDVNRDDGAEAILKAGYGNISMDCRISQNLYKTDPKLFPKVYVSSNFMKIQGMPFYCITEKLGKSLYMEAEGSASAGASEWSSAPIFAGFDRQTVNNIAKNIIKRLEVLHTLKDEAFDIEGITHNDIKPGNVLFGSDGDRNNFYIIDFDVYKNIRPDVKKSGKFEGTEEFAGAEYLIGYIPTPKTDLDSLGQLLIWCATGNLPWTKTKKPKELGDQKLQWRKAEFNDRKGIKDTVIPDSYPNLRKYFNYVENLDMGDLKPDYDKLASLFD